MSAQPQVETCCGDRAARRCRTEGCRRTFCEECALDDERTTGYCYMCLDAAVQWGRPARARRWKR